MQFDPKSLRFDANGLLPAVAQDHQSGQVLMLAWMNLLSLEKTLETGLVTYWSRSRKSLWVKGGTSGNLQHLVEIRLDCDRDALLILVAQTGPACHTLRESCFYTAIRDGAEVVLSAPLA